MFACLSRVVHQRLSSCFFSTLVRQAQLEFEIQFHHIRVTTTLNKQKGLSELIRIFNKTVSFINFLINFLPKALASSCLRSAENLYSDFRKWAFFSRNKRASHSLNKLLITLEFVMFGGEKRKMCCLSKNNRINPLFVHVVCGLLLRVCTFITRWPPAVTVAENESGWISLMNSLSDWQRHKSFLRSLIILPAYTYPLIGLIESLLISLRIIHSMM